MPDSDIELAKAALRVLPENEPSEFERWYQSPNSNNSPTASPNATSDCIVVNYNLNLANPLDLPPSLIQFEQTIHRYLRNTSFSDPWGMLNDEIVLLKLSDQPNSRAGRLLLFKITFVSALFKRLFPGEQISPGEQMTVLQTLSGLTLREAAKLDGVNYETKRTQLKAVFQKTQIKRQQTLSSFLIAHLTLEVVASHSRQPTGKETDEQFFNYVDNFMGAYVRASVIQESPDKRYRIIEIGDATGVPVVCIHHLGILNFSVDDINHIRAQGVRLICPLRQGAIGPLDEKISAEQHIEHAIEGIDLAVSLVPKDHVQIVTVLSGCYYALHYINRYPSKISNLTMISAAYKPSHSNRSLTGFKRNLHSLAMRNPKMFAAAVSFLVSQVENPEKLRKVWKESLNGSESDFAQVDAVFEDEQQLASMQHRLKHSAVSIIRDLQIQAKADWTLIESAPKSLPVHFIHGDCDTVIPIKNVQEFVDQRHNTFLHEIEGAGNWAFGDYTNKVYKIIHDLAV